MKINQFRLILLAVSVVVLDNASRVSRARAEGEDPNKLPRSGSLSSTVTGTHDSLAVPGPWGGFDKEGASAAPISGSVSRGSAEQWIMRLFNNSGDTYSVDVAVGQFDRTGNKIKSDSFSYTLRPKQAVDRTISSATNAENASLDLVNWKRTGSKKSEPPPKPAAP